MIKDHRVWKRMAKRDKEMQDACDKRITYIFDVFVCAQIWQECVQSLLSVSTWRRCTLHSSLKGLPLKTKLPV